MITVENAVTMGIGLDAQGRMISQQEPCDWVLVCKHPYVHIYMNVNSIFGSPRTFAFRYYMVDENDRKEFQKAHNLDRVPLYTIELKRYNSDFTSYTIKAAAFLDNRNQLINLKEVNQVSQIAANSLDSCEAQWAKPLYENGEDFIPYLKDTMKKFFASH